MAVSVLDTGDCLMVGGDSREEVDGALVKYVGRGAKILAEAVADGSRWTGACTIPERAPVSDISDRLKLSELREAASRMSAEADVEDGCSVEEVGVKYLVTGPSPREVLLRVQHMTRFGGYLVGNIAQADGKWLAIVDTPCSAKNSGRRSR